MRGVDEGNADERILRRERLAQELAGVREVCGEGGIMQNMMKCGHAANATCEGKPACAICAPHPESLLIDDAPPDLTGRMARCSCGKTEASDPGRLAFFEYRGPGSPHAIEQCVCGYYECAHGKPHIKCKKFKQGGPAAFDLYYCGCSGWD